MLHIEFEKETNNYDDAGGFTLTHARWLSLLLYKICVGWLDDALLTWINARW